jgi:hypothetical protein
MATDDDYTRSMTRSNAHSNLPSSGVSASNSLARAYSERLTMPEALEAVGKLLGAYPNSRDGVRNSWMGTIAALLCKYPKQVALRCANPINGVAIKCKWLPTVADCVEWLEREQLPLRNAHDRERQVREQLADRRRYEQKSKAEDTEQRQLITERIKNEMRVKGFKFAGDQRGPVETPTSVRAKYNLTEEEWNALPDADPGAWQRISGNHRP